MFHPFPYQSECLGCLKTVRASGLLRALVVMASGLGKTVTAALDVKQWLEEYKKGRVLYICHQNDILTQAKTTFEAVLGSHLSFDFLHGERKTLHEVDCLFASFQTLVNYNQFFKPDEFDYIIVDESHHTYAELWLPVVQYYKPKFLCAVTATPDRADGSDIRDVYGNEVYNLPLEEALARGYLTPVDYKLMSDDIELQTILNAEGERLSLKELNKRVFVPRRDDEIAKIIQQHAAELADPRIIVFCSSIAHCDYMCPYLTNGLAIHSKIPSKEKDLRLELFRQGIINIALTVDCFNEGIDIPEANLIVFLRSTTSSTVFLQQLGRGLRRHKEKDKVVILDFAGNCDRVKFVTDLAKKVKRFQPSMGLSTSEAPINITGEGFNFNFSSKIVDLLSVMERMRRGFYLTWQEAAEAAKELAITSRVEYRERYKRDSQLPVAPEKFYPDFPGYGIFLATGHSYRTSFYATWQEASTAAQALNIQGGDDYSTRYKEDPLLPSSPESFYSDFPGWREFLRIFYLKWEEAAEAAQKLAIKTCKEYPEQYKRDPLLPSSPNTAYEDFPGWGVFLGTGNGQLDFYGTWEEAGSVASGLGISTSMEYKSGCKEKDPRLPSHPENVYPDFPGWKKFLGRE